MIVQYKGKRKVDIIPEKKYEVLSIERGWYRIVDESGEDYLYSPAQFDIIEAEPPAPVLAA
ncbi:MAG: hypothetical protein IJ849_11715 [Selenomonadaceae bacterium]|nr:hypothetical protein [Selenomonadaceae bacterium]